MTLRSFRANRHRMYLIKSDKIFEIEAPTLPDDTWESHSLQDRNNPSRSKLLLEAATRLERYLAVLNSQAVAGMPSIDFESNAATSLFDLPVPKGYDWQVYQEDTPDSDEYFNFIKRSEILHHYFQKHNPPFNATILSLIKNFTSNTTSAAFSPGISPVAKNMTSNMQDEGNNIKSSSTEIFK
jgi:hypothetical protein